MSQPPPTTSRRAANNANAVTAMDAHRTRGLTLCAAALIAGFCLVYAKDAGHGFVKDDFAWIVNGRLANLASLHTWLMGSGGFYRPVVSLTFAINEAAFGLWSLGYGLTNLALALACAAAVFGLCVQRGLGSRAALVAAAAWAFNFHGINMAVLWISGRTALCLTLFSVLAVIATLKRRPGWAFVLSLAALGSKEEAVVLPFIVGLWSIVSDSPSADPRRVDRPGTDPPGRRIVRGLVSALPIVLALAVYLALRSQSGALTPDTAPAYYRFTLDPRVVARNIAEYADRSSTLVLAVGLFVCAVLRVRPTLDAVGRTVMLQGLIWLVFGFALTVWLPVRSSLYAVWPSVGAALILAAVVRSMIEGAPSIRVRRLAMLAPVVVLLALPIYWSRNTRWVELADLSSATVGAIASASPAIAPGTLIVLRDDGQTRANFANAFGTLVPEMSALYFDSRYEVWIEPPPSELLATGAARPALPAGAIFELRSGTVVRAERP